MSGGKGPREPAGAGVPDEAAIRRTILRLCRARGAHKTICPSEAARAIAGDDPQAWRRLMKPVRAAAVAMARAGEIEITRKGRPVDPDAFKGVYRLRLSGGRPPPAPAAAADVRPSARPPQAASQTGEKA